MENQYNDKIVLNIRQIRKAKGMTQQELAHKIGITKACMCRWENWSDGSPVPTLRTLNRIAQALGVKIKDLFDENVAHG